MNTNNGTKQWRDPYHLINDFRGDFDRLFDDWLTPSPRGLRTESHFLPACDVEEQNDHYLLTLEMAGVRKDDIKMEVINNQIVISGERRNEVRRSEDGLKYSERQFGKFQRAFGLPVGVDTSQVEADYQDGILRVVIPKAESAKPRQIKITQGSAGSKLFGKFLSPPKEKEEQQSPITEKTAS